MTATALRTDAGNTWTAPPAEPRWSEIRELIDLVLDIIGTTARARTGAVSAGGPDGAADAFRQAVPGPLLPDAPGDAHRVVSELVTAFAEWSVDLGHPGAVARMQCLPEPPAVAAEVAVAVLNQSLHAWESGPSALELDRWVTDELAALVGFGSRAGGTLTAGGSVSNLMALQAAREHAVDSQLGSSAFSGGLAAVGRKPVVLCSPATHFSISRAMGLAGLGSDSIIRVSCDDRDTLVPAEVDRTLSALADDDVLPVAVVACAGTTDLGEIDPLRELATIAHRHGVWLHVDAAYGGGALFSQHLRGALAGIEDADSVTLDLHKFGWTPAAAGVFLVRDAASLGFLSDDPTTLNAEDDRGAGYVGRYATSIQATRRVDALKIATTLRTLGRQGLGERVDTCHALAKHAAARLRRCSQVHVAVEPALSTVVFRYLPAAAGDVDEFNASLRRRLMAAGSVLTARTTRSAGVPTPAVFLKLMLLNPATSVAELDEVVDAILAEAASLDEEHRRAQ